MNDEKLDNYVKAHLDQQAKEVDAHAFLSRLRAATPSESRWQWQHLRRWAFAVAAAFLIVVAFFAGSVVGPPSKASAETIVRDAQRVHALPTDRCYLVQVTPEPGGALEEHPRLLDKGDKRLWTRGDRFWLESLNPARPMHLGRDDQGRVWIALGTRQGLRLDPDELSEPLGMYCDVLSMQVETLLSEVLANFELTRQEKPGTYIITAEPKPDSNPQRLRSAVLEIDTETKVLKRLVLSRAWRGKPLATTTYSLIDTTPQLDVSYQLEGHLDADAPVFTRESEKGTRSRLIRQYFNVPANPNQ